MKLLEKLREIAGLPTRADVIEKLHKELVPTTAFACDQISQMLRTFSEFAGMPDYREILGPFAARPELKALRDDLTKFLAALEPPPALPVVIHEPPSDENVTWN